MKVRSSIRSLAKQPGSVVVRGRGHTYVINKANPRLKARQGRAEAVRIGEACLKVRKRRASRCE